MKNLWLTKTKIKYGWFYLMINFHINSTYISYIFICNGILN